MPSFGSYPFNQPCNQNNGRRINDARSMTNTIVLPEGALTIENEVDRAVVGRIKGLGLNLNALPQIDCTNCRME